MLNVGLTGNVAAGKSSVGRLFAGWGATVIDADAIVRELQQPGTPVMAAIAARFGPEVLHADGTLDRAALRRRILTEASARLDLNAIMHPAVMARRAELQAAAQARGVPIVVNDIPLLFEVTDPAAYDAIVLVDAPAALRRDRLQQLRGLSAVEANALIASQQPSEEKRARSTYVIDNTGDVAALERAARAVWQALEARARA